MADGCPGIIFQHPAEGAFHKDDQRLPEIFLYGQSTQHAELSLSGKFNAIGICLYPNALRSLFGLKAEELTDSCMDLNHTARRQGFRLVEQLSDKVVREIAWDVVPDLAELLIKQRLEDEARRIHDADVANCRTMGAHGATLVPDTARILTHCQNLDIA